MTNSVRVKIFYKKGNVLDFWDTPITGNMYFKEGRVYIECYSDINQTTLYELVFKLDDISKIVKISKTEEVVWNKPEE